MWWRMGVRRRPRAAPRQALRGGVPGHGAGGALLAQRNPALADWLAVADAPTLARSRPVAADVLGSRLHVREATKDLTVDDALASGQKALRTSRRN